MLRFLDVILSWQREFAISVLANHPQSAGVVEDLFSSTTQMQFQETKDLRSVLRRIMRQQILMPCPGKDHQLLRFDRRMVQLLRFLQGLMLSASMVAIRTGQPALAM